ncbi:MAG: carboxypeptidase-like regulatory domain-containing protein [Saprospiraceae bacterium]|nr:carboxypeptidase-like regulatory domain-containing protein [Saprospiraceae bacterium]
MKKVLTLILLFLFVITLSFGQKSNAIIRGNIYDKNGGQPVPFANVVLRGTIQGATTDINGFYQISNVKAGDYTLFISFIGYDSIETKFSVREGEIVYKSFYLNEAAKSLDVVEISGKKEAARTTTLVSKLTITQKEIKSLPSTGGEPDIAQYLTVVPGVLTTGDQGGQIYIRGGSPVQNKILLDGMTIYNPFHSIGFFSVFETEAIRSVDVLTGGFSAEYGGRISAVVDIKTREGNKTRFSGLVSGSPFQTKVLVEGPLVKLKNEGGPSVSFILTGKKSLLPQTSKTLYDYARKDSTGLPFDYQDFYGKVSLVASGGSRLNIFGFNFTDGVNYPSIADLNWKTRGYGANFQLVPAGLKMLVGGSVTASNYNISLLETDPTPRTSGVNSFAAGLDFTVFGNQSELKYGVEISGFTTDLGFRNPLGFDFKQNENTTELAGFVKYRKSLNRLVIEPSLHIHNYNALGETTFEPRFAAKLNASDKFRFKFSGGLFSQNLISTVSEKDIVNLFVGYISGPEEKLLNPDRTAAVSSRLQKAMHIIGGFEVDLSKRWDLNVEGYYKKFNQLIDINRTKTKLTDPNYITETGDAYGIDFSSKYADKHWSFWGTFSHAYVTRFDGDTKLSYPTNFDRRNNINLVATYMWGENNSWEASLRWNFGSGFPFTQTVGFYTKFPFTEGVNTNVLTGNPDLGIIYSSKRNGGRLPDYHRLDMSVKKAIKFTKYVGLDIVASATNAYNRENIFYFDRVKYTRVNQLPILPSVAATFHF